MRPTPATNRSRTFDRLSRRQTRSRCAGIDRSSTRFNSTPDEHCISCQVWASELEKGPFTLQTGENHRMIDLWAYKTELGSVAGEICNPELGMKQVVAPFDL